MKKLRYAVRGMSCAACVAHVEHAAARVVDKDAASVSLLTATLTVTEAPVFGIISHPQDQIFTVQNLLQRLSLMPML